MSTDLSVEKSILENGVTVLVDRDPRWNSVACAVCVIGGLRGEKVEEVGITHLVEHVLFKRTKQRDTLSLAQALDDLGGDVNGFTDADSLCLHAVVPKQQFPEAFALFSELLLDCDFSESDLRVEKDVIRQEIIEASDDPEDAVYQCFAEHFWPNSMLAQPVFGTVQSLETFTAHDVRKKLTALLQGSRIVVGIVGDVDSDDCLALVEKYFSALPTGSRGSFETPSPAAGTARVVKQVEQVHVILGAPWPAQRDENYFAGELVSTVLGEGMSSRLFQLLREKHGLVYDVGSGVDTFPDVAALEVSAVVEPKNLGQALSLLVEELERIRTKGVTDDELQRAIRMTAASIEMEVDSISSRLWRAVEQEVLHGRYRSPAESVRAVRAVTAAHVQQVIDRHLHPGRFLLALAGDVEELEIEQSVLEWCAVKPR